MEERFSRFSEALKRLGDVSTTVYDTADIPNKPSRSHLQKAMNMSWDAMKSRALGAVSAADTKDETIRDFEENKGVVTTKSLHVKTLEDALAVANVDTDVWAVKRHVINSWEVTVGKRGTNTGKPETYTNWQVKVWLERKVPKFQEDAVAKLVETMKEYSPTYAYPRIHSRGDDLMYEMCLFDVHLGKRAWGLETGEDYDTDIGSKRFLDANEDLLSRVEGRKIDKIIFPAGNDFLHIDTILNTTTKGTRQDSDDRLHFLFHKGLLLLVKAIDMCAMVAPKVEVIIVPDNHANETTLNLGVALMAWYRLDDRVSVDFSPKARKYVRYKKNLIGYVHGSKDDPPIKDLPLLMLEENSKIMHEIAYKELHLGHLHKTKEISFLSADSMVGIDALIIPSITGTDEWHFKRGYVGKNKKAVSFLWNGCGGYESRFYSLVR